MELTNNQLLKEFKKTETCMNNLMSALNCFIEFQDKTNDPNLAIKQGEIKELLEIWERE